jgi:kinetochore protein Spc25
MKKKDIEILSSKTDSHQQTLAKEAAETQEIQSMIATLSAQRDSHLSTKEYLKQRIKDTQKQIDARLAAQKAHAQYIEEQTKFNIPELDFYESTLCLAIEGAGQVDRLKFTYTHIDDRDWTREAFFELDMSKRDYEIVYCKPKLEKEQIERVVDRLNETRGLRTCLKEIRDLFVDTMKSS